MFFHGCAGEVSLSGLNSHELFDLGKDLYDDEKYIKAIEHFQAIVYNYPGEAIVDTAQYYLALSYFGNEDYTLAGVEFNRLVLNYPSSEYFENALFLKAASYYQSTPKHHGLDQRELEKAIRQLNDFIIDYPESESVADAKQLLSQARTRMAKKYYKSGEVYKHMGAFESARTYYQIVIDDYTDIEEYSARALSLIILQRSFLKINW